MDMQNVAKLNIPEGEVRTIRNGSGDLLWGKISYGVKYEGDTSQSGTPAPDAPVPVLNAAGVNTISIGDGINTSSYILNLGSIEMRGLGEYRDYFYKSGDMWYIHKVIEKISISTLSGYTYNVNTTQANTTRLWIQCITSDAANIPVSDQIGTYKSNRFEFASVWSRDVEGMYVDLASSPQRIVLRANKSTIGTDATSIDAWLANNPIDVYYVLANPTDTQVTDTVLAAQLNSINQWLIRYGYSAQVAGNLPIIIDRTAP